MADLSFKEELSEIHEKLRRLDAKVDTIFLMQVHVLSELRGVDSETLFEQWIKTRDYFLEPDDPSSP